MMTITIEYHGVTARLAGGPEHALELPAGARIGEALALLTQRVPALAPVLAMCACAVGDRVVARSHVLAAGERLALLPPVSGG